MLKGNIVKERLGTSVL